MNEHLSNAHDSSAAPAAKAPDQPVPSDRAFYTWAAVVLILAAALRFLFIARFQIWLDEAYCFVVARKSFSAILADLVLDNGPPLYYMLLHYWMSAFGESAVALRSLSALFSTATIAIILLWDAPWFPRRARLLAGFMLAITPLDIYYAQEARMYAPVAFFVAASMIFLDRGLRMGRLMDWALFAAATAVALYTNYVAIFLVPVGYLTIAVMALSGKQVGGARKAFASLVAAHVAAAVLFLPWLPTFIQQPSEKATKWILPLWKDFNKPRLPLESLSMMTTGGAYYPRYLSNLGQGPERAEVVKAAVAGGVEKNPLIGIFSRIPVWIPLAATLLLAAALLFTALWRHWSQPQAVFLVSWVLLSFLVPIVLSFGRPMFVPGRYEMTGVPAFAIISGIALSRMGMKLRLPCLALATALFVYTWTYAEVWPPSEGNRERAATVARIASPGDTIMCELFEYSEIYYHFGPGRDSITWLTCPREIMKHAAWLDYDKWLSPEWDTPRPSMWEEASKALQEAIDVTPQGHRLIVVRPLDAVGCSDAVDLTLRPAVMSAVEAGTMIPDMVASIPDKGVVVLTKPPAAGPGVSSVTPSLKPILGPVSVATL